ncbi:beta-1,3-galactosyltransferase 2-like isoform X2 [Hyla sarda]|nr:beta-1,3-galactosyltransferase 2-like isoform X2 [Hyla sarda]XP_056425107.1 beta-1,3-galactosyltransferase 2-like isoform X2 [Hyla sarda]
MFLQSYGFIRKYLRCFQKAIQNSPLCIWYLFIRKKTRPFLFFRILLLVFFFCFVFSQLFTSGNKGQRLFARASKILANEDQEIIVLNRTSPARWHPLVTPYPYPYKFLMNAPEKCQRRNPFLVLLVTGECHDVKARDTIRKTWGNEDNYGDVVVMKIFLVGISPILTDAMQQLLKEENAIYGDIVQQDFLDTYSNLTLKTLMGMEWVTKFCPNASYVMKVDNDVFVNVPYLIHQLLHPERPPLTNYVTGFIVENSSPNRHNYSKWYLPEEIYPSKIFPPYLSGPGYVLSGDMAKKIYDVAQEILVFSIEDAFIGVCLYKMKITITPPPKNVFHGLSIAYDYKVFSGLVMVHHYKNEDLLIVWSQFWNGSYSGEGIKTTTVH